MNFINVYAQHIGTFFYNKLLINDGIRYSATSLNSTIADNSFIKLPYNIIVQNTNALTAQLGISYKLFRNMNLYYQYNSGFRAANIDDAAKIFESKSYALIVPNATLQPEKSHNHEIGLKLLNGLLNADLSIYQTNLSNAMVLDKYNLNGKDSVNYLGANTAVYAMQNKANALIRGLQANAKFIINANYVAYGNITFTNGTFTNLGITSNLDHIPPTYGQLGFSYTKNNLFAEINTQFNDLKPLRKYRLNTEDNESYATSIGMPSWYTINIKSNIAISNYIQLACNIDNIMDVHYRTFGSGISAAGRNIALIVRVKF
jgi:hemoglobin/transferrin/lactoferrin receptor protein